MQKVFKSIKMWSCSQIWTARFMDHSKSVDFFHIFAKWRWVHTFQVMWAILNTCMQHSFLIKTIQK